MICEEFSYLVVSICVVGCRINSMSVLWEITLDWFESSLRGLSVIRGVSRDKVLWKFYVYLVVHCGFAFRFFFSGGCFDSR